MYRVIPRCILDRGPAKTGSPRILSGALLSEPPPRCEVQPTIPAAHRPEIPGAEGGRGPRFPGLKGTARLQGVSPTQLPVIHWCWFRQ